MSIQKDVKKMYMNDLERENKKLKKKRKKRLLGLVAVIIIALAIILLLSYLGLGLGGGKGNGGAESVSESSSVAETTVSTTVTTEAPKILVDIKVSGSTYIYDGQEISLDDFKAKLATMNDNVVISITDDNATANAMTDLEEMLDSEGRQFTIAQAKTDSSAVDSLSESSESEEDF